jgi:hypothetical protein
MKREDIIMNVLLKVIGQPTLIFIALISVNCGDNTENPKNIDKNFVEAISKLPYSMDSLAITIDTLTNKGFKSYLQNKIFNRIDSLNISRRGFERGYRFVAYFDTITYKPIVASIPNYGSDNFAIIYAAGQMNLNFIKIIINYKAQNGGYSYSDPKEIPATTVGYLGYGNFFGNDGKKMPSGLKPMDIMTIFSIKGRSRLDTSIAFADLTREE